jgi:hypothetical protein
VFDSEIDDVRILLDCDTGLADYPLTTGVRQFVLINSGNTVARANQPALQAELMRTLAERTTSMTNLRRGPGCGPGDLALLIRKV